MCPPSRPPQPGPGAELRGLQGEAEEIDILISIYIYDRRVCVPSARTISWTLTCPCGHRRSARTSACKCSVLDPSSSSRCPPVQAARALQLLLSPGQPVLPAVDLRECGALRGLHVRPAPAQPRLMPGAACLLGNQWSLLSLAKNLNFTSSQLIPM